MLYHMILMDQRKKDEFAYSEVIRVRIMRSTKETIDDYVNKKNKVNKDYKLSWFIREAIESKLFEGKSYLEEKLIIAESFLQDSRVKKLKTDKSSRENYLTFLAELLRYDPHLKEFYKICDDELREIAIQELINQVEKFSKKYNVPEEISQGVIAKLMEELESVDLE